MEIFSNYPLKSLNTFGINVDGKYFVGVASLEEIREAIQFAQNKKIPVMVLGGGSNVLFTQDYEGLLLKVKLEHIQKIRETADHVYIKAGAGVNWDAFVAYCVEKQYAGLENLSLIPGNVGASPIQNIGAYGVEMRDHFEELECYHIEQDIVEIFSADECQFGYRDSIFKRTLKGKVIILNVTFRLDKVPDFKTDYGAVREELERMNVKSLTLAHMRQAIIQIRQSKLPDPNEIGNAGSFFKNPEVSAEFHHHLKSEFPDLVSYPLDHGNYKLAAGWLIDQCGWKGYREGDAGVHAKQALVLVNYGHASGQDLMNLSENVMNSVKSRFGVELEREVNVV